MLWPPADFVYSSSVSFLIRSDSFLSSLVHCSISRTGRQFSNCCAEAFGYDKNNRKGDSDESDAPLLLEGEHPVRECDGVRGGEKRDEADDNPRQNLNDPWRSSPGNRCRGGSASGGSSDGRTKP